MAQQKYEAIILAGGTMPDGTPKALLKLDGKLIVNQVIRAARSCPQISRIILVSSLSTEECNLSGVDAYAAAGSTIAESFLSGVRMLKSGGRIVSSVGDMPFVKSEHWSRFIKQAELHQDAEVILSYLSRETSEKGFKGIHHTCAKNLINNTGGRGDYHMAGINMIDIGCVEAIVSRMNDLEPARKSVLKLAWTLGFGEIFWYLLGCLLGYLSMGGCYKIARGERALSRLIQVRCIGIEIFDAELGLDIDKDSKKEQALQFVGRYQLV